MKRVLLVTFIFPPQLGGPSEKMARRAKYFARFGWQTVVLAPDMPPGSGLDTTLLDELDNVEIHRTPYLFQSRWPSLRHDKNRVLEIHQTKLQRAIDMAFVPKGYVRWLPYALRTGRRLAASVDVILTINNPVTLHLVGLVLHKLTGKPWVAEFRDPIVEYAYGRRGPEKLNYWLERQIVHHADAIIRRADGTPGNISQRYPHLPPSKFTVIPYAGYDPDDFAGNKPEPPSNAGLLISYTGRLYGETITPIPFLKGFKRFLSQGSVPSSSVRVVFAGDWETRYDQQLDDLNLQNSVKYLGRLTRQECLHLWQQSHVLLLILGKEPDNLMRIPSKFWDYLGAQRTILALVHPEGRVAQLVHEQRLGFVADTEDDAAIAAALQEIWQAHRRGALKPQPTPDLFAQATRPNSEKAVVDVLDRFVEAQSRHV